MTKKLLFLLDTDPVPSVFDTVVGYDGGADHIIGYGGVTPANVGALVDGTIYTRGPRKAVHRDLVGGGNMNRRRNAVQGREEALLLQFSAFQ